MLNLDFKLNDTFFVKDYNYEITTEFKENNNVLDEDVLEIIDISQLSDVEVYDAEMEFNQFMEYYKITILHVKSGKSFDEMYPIHSSELPIRDEDLDSRAQRVLDSYTDPLESYSGFRLDENGNPMLIN